MRIGRTLPPAAAPLGLSGILTGLAAPLCGRRSVGDFEREVAQWLGVKHCHALSSGTAALTLGLAALRKLHPNRDEVLIPAYTCYSVPSAIVRAGLKVRLCDLAAGSFDFDYDALETMLSHPRLLCVIATHLYGIPSDIRRLRGLTRRHGIPVIEDAAQAMGGETEGKLIGATGDIGLFSLGRGKACSTVAGGIITTDSDTVAREIGQLLPAIDRPGSAATARLVAESLALWLMGRPGLFWLPKSLPFLRLGETRYHPCFPIRRMSSFQAGLSLGWRSRLEYFSSRRQSNVAHFRTLGVRPHGISGTADLPLLRLPVMAGSPAEKNALLAESEQNGMGLSGGYPDSIDGIAGLDWLGSHDRFPVARETARLAVTLPVHPFVTSHDIDRIARLLPPPAAAASLPHAAAPR